MNQSADSGYIRLQMPDASPRGLKFSSIQEGSDSVLFVRYPVLLVLFSVISVSAHKAGIVWEPLYRHT